MIALAGWLTVAAVAAPTCVLADNSPGEVGTETIKVYNEKTLKPAEIRSCIRIDQQLVDLEQRLSAYEKTLESYLGKISALEGELNRTRKNIDATDADAVAAYNARVERHRTLVETYNSEFVPTLAEKRERLASRVAEYNARCAEKSYFEEDWLAALKELGVADTRPGTEKGR